MTSGKSTLGKRLLDEMAGNGCPACHHQDHDPGSCRSCPRCELHTDEALAFVLRIEPELIGTTVLDEWLREVLRDWRLHWRGHHDHRYGRDPEAFIGERLLTDFSLREVGRMFDRESR